MDSEKPKTILVVDDEPAIRLGLAATLKRQGYSVITAEDGNDGILKATQTLPDLILSDVMMPNMNGFELRRQLGTVASLASIPFIFLTARSASEDRVLGMREGADDYVTKPFVIDELLARVEAVLRRVHTEREHGRQLGKQDAEADIEKLRREILQNFRHEIRTPLGNIMMSLEMAINHKFETQEEQNEFIRIALTSVDRMEALVSDIILLSDLDQDQINTIRQSIHPEHHIIVPAQKRLQRYDHKGINFVQEIQAAEPIFAPRKEFTQVMVNLADNAFKFSPQGGKVTLRVKSTGNGGAMIEWEDEGPGIPITLHDKVFERFYQVSQGDNREHQGLGVGLTTARAIFASLGGDIKVLDREKGCCILAILPPLKPEDIVYG
ncbi:MAG: hybrid sensor histidine kinase/response regulator [Anaerolineales bacterium]|nr:hybrid sensor histidine kinase/response regulator [Anaerolineales bacterium]